MRFLVQVKLNLHYCSLRFLELKRKKMLSRLYWEDFSLIYKALYLNHVASKATYPSQKLLGNILIPPPPIRFLPCRVACRILVPQPGIKPVLPALGAQSLNCWTTRDVPGNILNEWIFSMESVNKQLIKAEFHIIFLKTDS